MWSVNEASTIRFGAFGSLMRFFEPRLLKPLQYVLRLSADAAAKRYRPWLSGLGLTACRGSTPPGPGRESTADLASAHEISLDMLRLPSLSVRGFLKSYHAGIGRCLGTAFGRWILSGGQGRTKWPPLCRACAGPLNCYWRATCKNTRSVAKGKRESWQKFKKTPPFRGPQIDPFWGPP